MQDMSKGLMALVVGLVLMGALSLYRATAPEKVTFPASGVTSNEPMAWDAHRRISEVAHDVSSRRWMTLFATIVAAVSVVAAYKAWDFAKSYGNGRTMETRLRALEQRQTVFLPTPTEYSTLFGISKEQPQEVVQTEIPAAPVAAPTLRIVPQRPMPRPKPQVPAGAMIPPDLVAAFPATQAEADEAEPGTGDGIVG